MPHDRRNLEVQEPGTGDLDLLEDAVSLLFQLASYAYLVVPITVSIKRAGIVLSVFAGWLFFRERDPKYKTLIQKSPALVRPPFG